MTALHRARRRGGRRLGCLAASVVLATGVVAALHLIATAIGG